MTNPFPNSAALALRRRYLRRQRIAGLLRKLNGPLPFVIAGAYVVAALIFAVLP